MFIFIIPEDGSQEAQALQYLKVKRGSNVQLTLKFYKDKFQLQPWNLASPVTLNAYMKKLKDSSTYVMSKDKTSVDWDLTDAASGILKLILNSTDIAAVITGDKTTFAGQAGDKIKVMIDSIEYDDIDISACVTIANVVSAINSAVGSTVASVSTDFLRITSPTSGDDSNVTIADGTNTTQTVIAELFSVAGNRTDEGAYGDLSVAQSLYFEVAFTPNASTRVYKTPDCMVDVIEDV